MPRQKKRFFAIWFCLDQSVCRDACTPMNIDPSRKDIEDWNKCVEDQAHLGPNEGQRDRNEVNQRRHERSFHPAADQVGMNVRIDMTSFGRGIPPMKSQRQTNRDEVIDPLAWRRLAFFHLLLGNYWSDVLEIFSFDEIDEFDSHCVTASLPDFAHSDPNHLAASGDQHHFIRFVDCKSPDDVARSVTGLHRDDPLAAPRLSPISVKACSFPDSV